MSRFLALGKGDVSIPSNSQRLSSQLGTTFDPFKHYKLDLRVPDARIRDEPGLFADFSTRHPSRPLKGVVHQVPIAPHLPQRVDDNDLRGEGQVPGNLAEERGLATPTGTQEKERGGWMQKVSEGGELACEWKAGQGREGENKFVSKAIVWSKENG